jgi:hypothetical protein
MRNKYTFIIDTDSYAGNFEREMTAYLTGHIGECEVGKELIYEDELINFDNIEDIADDNGCYRPTSCGENPNEGNKNYSVEIYFETKPTQEQIDFMKLRVEYFNSVSSNDIEIQGFRLSETVTTITTIPV